MIFVATAIFSTQKDEGKIKVGIVMPLSGPQAYLGAEMQKGLEICNPGNIVYIFEDCEGIASKGVSAFNKLNSIDNVDLTIVGLSTIVPAILPIAKDEKKFVITTITTASEVGKRGGDTVFRFYLDGENAAKTLADSMIKNEASKAGIFYVQNEFGQTYAKAAQLFFESNEIPVYKDSFQATELDFSTQITKLKNNKVDSILVIAYDKQSLQIISKLKESGIEAKIFTAWMWHDNDYKNNPIILEKVYTTRSAYLFSSGTKALNFNQEYKSKYDSQGSQFSAIGCDLSNLIGNNQIDTAEKMNNLNNFSGINGEIIPKEFGEFNFPIKNIQFSDENTNTLE